MPIVFVLTYFSHSISDGRGIEHTLHAIWPQPFLEPQVLLPGRLPYTFAPEAPILERIVQLDETSAPQGGH